MKKILAVGIVAAIAGVVIYLVAAQQGGKTQDAAAPAPAAPAGSYWAAALEANAAEPAPEPDAGQATEPKAADNQDAPKASADAGNGGKTDNGMAAMKQAAEAKKYLFVFFHAKADDQTSTFRKSFETAAAKIADKAMSVTVDVNSPAEKEIVEKFRIQNAPMPMVLSIAPNGAITGSYRGESSEKALLDTMVSPSFQSTLKALQEGKLVFLCVQNKTTKSNEAAMQGVKDFKADVRFAKFTETVAIDPSDTAEKAFLEKLQIDPKADEALTVFLAPPGAVVAKLKGATNKDGLIATLQAATAGGCGSGGCGPKGCAPTPPPQQ